MDLGTLAAKLYGEGQRILWKVEDGEVGINEALEEARRWFSLASRVEKVAEKLAASVPGASLEDGLRRLGLSVTRWVFRGDLTAFGFAREGSGRRVWVQCIRLAGDDPEEADIDRLERFVELVHGGGWIGEIRGAGWLVAVIRGREEVEVLERVADLVDGDIQVVTTYHNICIWTGGWNVEVQIPERRIVVGGEKAKEVAERLTGLNGFKVVVEDA